MNEYEKLTKALKCVRKITDFQPEIAVVLGSGLGDFAEKIQSKIIVHYSEIEGFPISTAPDHVGRYIFGYINGVPVVAMQGRVHYYEGYDMQQVVMPVRLMGMMGAKAVLLTNACGGINLSFNTGDFMMITSQISFFVPSPLRGPNIEEFGVRFPDMRLLYNVGIQQAIETASKKTGIPIQKGVYMQLAGPQFETTAEVKMADILGADVVGMSTACEAIAARHMGMLVGGISCITNMAAGVTDTPQTSDEVSETAQKVAGKFEALMIQAVTETHEFLNK